MKPTDGQPSGKSRDLKGLRRSLDVYYRDTERTARMDSLNRAFVTQGDLVFDLGAHVGDRTASFLRLGASVVALEPQPRIFRALKLLQGRKPGVVVLPWAVGQHEAEMTLYLNSENPTVSTLASSFIEATAGAKEWEGQAWDKQVIVPVTTLDKLISRYGTPDFVKIDVEGHEAEVLSGLTHAIPTLSFEFTTIQRACAYACIDRLSELGRYEYNISLGEDHVLRHRTWASADNMVAEILSLPEAANSGDVYARVMPD